MREALPYISLALTALMALYVIYTGSRKVQASGEGYATKADIANVRTSIKTEFDQYSNRLQQLELRNSELTGRFGMFVEMQHERAKLRVDDVHHPEPEHATADRLLDKFKADQLKDENEIRQLVSIMDQRRKDESLSRDERETALMIYWVLKLRVPL